MPFVQVRRIHSFVKESEKWESVRGNEIFCLEKKSRKLRSSLYRIRLIVCGNNLVLWEGEGRSDALREFEDLNNPSQAHQDSAQVPSSQLELFWNEATETDGNGSQSLLENIFPETYGEFSDSLRRTVLELISFNKHDVATAATDESDAQMLVELCSLSKLVLDTIIAFLKHRRGTSSIAGLSQSNIIDVSSANMLQGSEPVLVDIMSDLMDVGATNSTDNTMFFSNDAVLSPTSSSAPNDSAPPLPPKKSSSRTTKTVSSSTNPFDDFDAMSGFSVRTAPSTNPFANPTVPTTPKVPTKPTNATLDLDFLPQSFGSSISSNTTIRSSPSTVTPENSIENATTGLNSCVERIHRLRAAQFNVVQCLAHEFDDDAGVTARNTLHNAVFFLPFWHELSKPVDNAWASTVARDQEKDKIYAHLYNQVSVAGEQHPIGRVCSSFQQQFEVKFATPRGEDIASMHADLFVFVGALANGIVASFRDFSNSSSARQHVHDAVLDIVLQNVLPLVEQAYREKHRSLDEGWKLKQLELARAEPYMLGVPSQQCQAVSQANFTKTFAVLQGFTKHSSVYAMLKCLVSAMDSVIQDVTAASEQSSSKIVFAADDMLPIFCYVLLKGASSLDNVSSTIQLLDAFIPESARNGPEGYALVTLQVATEYLMSLDWASLESAEQKQSTSPSSTPEPSKVPRKRSLATVLSRIGSSTNYSSESSVMNVRSTASVSPAPRVVGEAACQLSIQLCEAMIGLCLRYERYFSPGAKVSSRVRAAMRADEIFEKIKEKLFLLDGVDPTSFSNDEQRFVFWINLYHTLLLHAHVELPNDMDSSSLNTTDSASGSAIALSKVARVALMRKAAYRVGGRRLALVEMEHAILRAQTSAPSVVILTLGGRLLVPKFKTKDARSGFCLLHPIPLVSLVLASLTRSSPPVRCFASIESVWKDVDKCVSLFLAENVHFDGRTQTLYLPPLFQWYKKDFGGSDKAVLKWLLPRLKNDLKNLIVSRGDDVRIKYSRFDWTEQWLIRR